MKNRIVRFPVPASQKSQQERGGMSHTQERGGISLPQERGGVSPPVSPNRNVVNRRAHATPLLTLMLCMALLVPPQAAFGQTAETPSTNKPDAAVVLLLSHSGAIFSDEWIATKNSAVTFVGSFSDRVDISFGIVLYADDASLILFPNGQYLSSDRTAVVSAIQELLAPVPNSLSNLYSGIVESERILASYEGPKNIVMIADGYPNALPSDYPGYDELSIVGKVHLAESATLDKIEEVQQSDSNFFVVGYGYAVSPFYGVASPLIDEGKYVHARRDLGRLSVILTDYAAMITTDAIAVATYTVTFADWNGAVLKTEPVVRGDAATAPVNPTRTGYTFTGWDNGFSEIAGDLTVTAQYVACEYVAVVTAPTCTADGFTTYTCPECGDSYIADETEALGHDYKSVATIPTCIGGGYTTYTCSRCGDSYVDDNVEALGHDYDWVYTDPTCIEDGYWTGTCVVCGFVDYEADWDSALGHDWDWNAPIWDGKEWFVVCNECGEIRGIVYDCDVYGCQRFGDSTVAETVGWAKMQCLDCGEWHEYELEFDDADVWDVYVEKLTGNQNRLWITVLEVYEGFDFPMTESFMIANNSAGTYTIGNTKVYVDTKGNTQIRAVSIAP